MINLNNFPPPPAFWWHGWSPAAMLRVHGEDALTFLQGQFSQDLRPAGVTQPAAYGLWLNPKGRVLADSFALVAGPAEVWLVSYYSAAADLRAHLERHIVADDAGIEDHTEEWRALAVGGNGAAAWLRASAGAEPPDLGSFTRVGGGGWMFRGRRGADPSWEWLAPAGALPACDAAAEITAGAMERMRVAAGVPVVPADIGPGDLPHEGGIDTASVSYTKGCYVGQEVMARLRTGTIRRRLARLRGMGTLPPNGTALFQGARKIGALRSTCDDGAGGWIGLAMLTLLGLEPAAPIAFAPEAPATVRLFVPPS